MYTTFIADDELIIRQGLRCILDWEELGFQIIGEAANGADALDFIIKNNPHLKKAELPVNTRYFIEEYMSELVKREKVTLRREEHRRKQVLVVLDFLVEKGSEVGFGMREDVV